MVLLIINVMYDINFPNLYLLCFINLVNAHVFISELNKTFDYNDISCIAEHKDSYLVLTWMYVSLC